MGSDRGFGDKPLRAGDAVPRFSEGHEEAAANLLHQAMGALYDGDDARARHLVERAVALPRDDHGRGHPAAVGAEQAMDDAVVGAIEEDPALDWLDAAVGTLDHGPPEGRLAMRDTLTAVLVAYDLGNAERHLRQKLAQVPERGELYALDLTPAQLADAVLEVLEGVLQFEDDEELGVLRSRGE